MVPQASKESIEDRQPRQTKLKRWILRPERLCSQILRFRVMQLLNIWGMNRQNSNLKSPATTLILLRHNWLKRVLVILKCAIWSRTQQKEIQRLLGHIYHPSTPSNTSSIWINSLNKGPWLAPYFHQQSNQFTAILANNSRKKCTRGSLKGARLS